MALLVSVGHVPVLPFVTEADGPGGNAPLQRAPALLDVEQLVDDGVLHPDLGAVLQTGLGVAGGQAADGPGPQCRLPEGGLSQVLADGVDGILSHVLFGCHGSPPFKSRPSRGKREKGIAWP